MANEVLSSQHRYLTRTELGVVTPRVFRNFMFFSHLALTNFFYFVFHIGLQEKVPSSACGPGASGSRRRPIRPTKLKSPYMDV